MLVILPLSNHQALNSVSCNNEQSIRIYKCACVCVFTEVITRSVIDPFIHHTIAHTSFPVKVGTHM
jgi:hypothetical protein